MRIWRAVRGEGSELGILARTQSTPLQIRTGIVVSAEKGWRRDAGKLPMNRGKSAVYIYTPLILLTGLNTDCSPLVLIRLIIWTCSSRTLLIKHHLECGQRIYGGLFPAPGRLTLAYNAGLHKGCFYKVGQFQLCKDSLTFLLLTIQMRVLSSVE